MDNRIRVSLLAVLSTLAIILPAPVAAAELMGGERVVIPAGEVKSDDVIAGADTFLLEGTIEGDLVVVGGTVTIAQSGLVEGDLIAAGGNVVLEGQVRDDARIAGAVLTVGRSATIGDDLIAAGQSLETQPGSLVGGELLFGGAQGLLAGGVVDGGRLGAASLDLRGRFGGNVQAAVGEPGQGPRFSPRTFFKDLPPAPEVAPGLTVRPGARINGDLKYVARQDVAIPAGTVGGRVTRQEPEAEPGSSSTGLVVGALRTLAALLVIGLLLVWLAPGVVKDTAETLRSRPGASFGWGAAGLFASVAAGLGIVLAAALAAVVLGGLSLGGLTALAILAGIVALAGFMLAFVVVAFYVSKVVVAWLGGRLLLARIKPEWSGARVAPLLVGVPVLVLLGALPVLGNAVHLLAALLGLGALLLLARDRFRTRPATAVEPETGTTEATLPIAA